MVDSDRRSYELKMWYEVLEDQKAASQVLMDLAHRLIKSRRNEEEDFSEAQTISDITKLKAGKKIITDIYEKGN